MTKITEDYVSFEVAKLLKEKGFDISCDNYYDSSGKTPNESVYGGANIETLDYNADPFVKSGFPKFKTFSAPTLQMAMKWLREEKNIFIVIEPYAYDYVNEKNKSYSYSLWIGDNYYEFLESRDYPSYEEAVEAAIKYCLENLI